MKEYNMCGVVLSREKFNNLTGTNTLQRVMDLTKYFQGGALNVDEEIVMLLMVPPEFKTQLEEIFPDEIVEDIIADEDNFSVDHPYRKEQNDG